MVLSSLSVKFLSHRHWKTLFKPTVAFSWTTASQDLLVKSRQVSSAYETTNPSKFESQTKFTYNRNKIQLNTLSRGTPYSTAPSWPAITLLKYVSRSYSISEKMYFLVYLFRAPQYISPGGGQHVYANGPASPGTSDERTTAVTLASGKRRQLLPRVLNQTVGVGLWRPRDSGLDGRGPSEPDRLLSSVSRSNRKPEMYVEKIQNISSETFHEIRKVSK